MQQLAWIRSWCSRPCGRRSLYTQHNRELIDRFSLFWYQNWINPINGKRSTYVHLLAPKTYAYQLFVFRRCQWRCPNSVWQEVWLPLSLANLYEKLWIFNEERWREVTFLLKEFGKSKLLTVCHVANISRCLAISTQTWKSMICCACRSCQCPKLMCMNVVNTVPTFLLFWVPAASPDWTGRNTKWWIDYVVWFRLCTSLD